MSQMQQDIYQVHFSKIRSFHLSNLHRLRRNINLLFLHTYPFEMGNIRGKCTQQTETKILTCEDKLLNDKLNDNRETTCIQNSQIGNGRNNDSHIIVVEGSREQQMSWMDRISKTDVCFLTCYILGEAEDVESSTRAISMWEGFGKDGTVVLIVLPSAKLQSKFANDQVTVEVPSSEAEQLLNELIRRTRMEKKRICMEKKRT